MGTWMGTWGQDMGTGIGHRDRDMNMGTGIGHGDRDRDMGTEIGHRDMGTGTAAPPPWGGDGQQGDNGEGTTGGQPPLCEDVAPAWGHPQVPAGCPQMPPGCPQEQLLSLKDKTTSFCALCQSCLSNGDAGVREQVTARGQRARWHLGGPVPTLSPLSPLSPRPSWC